MLTQLHIPKKINIGFQNRQDTYTGKLAYIVYKDNKGILRKEKSWEGWRDQKIESQEFENVPTSGFVLNKKVGGHRGGWTVANLLFILEETSSIKGKGLEGEFVYSWDKAELVLLPVNCQEYQSSSNFTDLQTKKITQKEMKEGCLYRNKENQEVMYLDRQDWYQLEDKYQNNEHQKYLKHEKQHVFVSLDGKSTYWVQNGFTKLANKLNEEPSPLFADEFEKFKNLKIPFTALNP